MAVNRKLGRETSHRLSMLRNLVSSTIAYGEVETTHARAKEAQRILDSLISMAVRETDNYDTREVVVSRAQLDGDGRKMLQQKESVNGRIYDTVVREVDTKAVKVDQPSRQQARRKAMHWLVDLKDVDGSSLRIGNFLFDELGSRYQGRKGGYTRVTRLGTRRGDGAEMARLQLLPD